MQYNVTSDVEWKILETTDNTALEELYCDENIEGIFKLNPAQAIEGSFFPNVMSVGLYHMRSKITEYRWPRQRAFFPNQEGTFGKNLENTREVNP